MNLFATVLTYPAPTANYRGESEQNRTVIQKITDGRLEYPIISPEAMRNALREILASYGLPCNRSRLHDEEQLKVEFTEYPNPEKYIDDFFFGYMVAVRSAERTKISKELEQQHRRIPFQFKRDSILRMNLAKGLEPYRHDSVFTQSPRNSDDSPWRNADSSALLHRETVQTAFQYPFALNLNECKEARFRRRTGEDESEAIGLEYLLKAIGELNGVAGNHTRSYYEMAPASIVIRLSESLVAGYDTYGFTKEGDFPEVTDGIRKGDYPGGEFFIGGKSVKEMSEENVQILKARKVTLDRSAQRLIATVTKKILGKGIEE